MKFFEVSVLGNGDSTLYESKDWTPTTGPYRADVPPTVDWVGTDGNVAGGVGGKMLIGVSNSVSDTDITNKGGVKLRKFEELSSNDKKKVEAFRKEKVKSDEEKDKVKEAQLLEDMPDCLEKKAIQFDVDGEDELSKWKI